MDFLDPAIGRRRGAELIVSTSGLPDRAPHLAEGLRRSSSSGREHRSRFIHGRATARNLDEFAKAFRVRKD